MVEQVSSIEEIAEKLPTVRLRDARIVANVMYEDEAMSHGLKKETSTARRAT